MILGSGETNCIALGVVGSQQSLGDEGTVGYHIRNLSPESDQETIGMSIYYIHTEKYSPKSYVVNIHTQMSSSQSEERTIVFTHE